MPRIRRSPFVPEDLARLRFPREPRISPDGRWVAYVEMTSSLVHNRAFHHLRLVDVLHGHVHAWTQGEHSDTSPAWFPDSRGVVFTADRGSRDGLWRIGIGAAQPEHLIEMDGRVSSPRVSPDGRAVAFLFTARSPLRPAPGHHEPAPGPQARHTTRLGCKRDGQGFHDTWTHLWVLDLATRRARQLTFGEADDGEPVWSPGGRFLAFVSNRVPRADVRFENSDIFIVPAHGGRPRQLTRAMGPKHAPAWSPDGRHIAYLGHDHFPDTIENTHVWVVPTGRGRARDLFATMDLMCDDVLLSDARDVSQGGAMPPVWSADGRRLFFAASQHGSVNVWEVEARGGRPRQRSFGSQHIADFSQSADGHRWAFLRLSPVSPGDIFVATATGEGSHGDAVIAAPRAETAQPRRLAAGTPLVLGAEVRRLTRTNDTLLARRLLFAPEALHVPTKAGHGIQGWVLRARGTGGARRRARGPAVLSVHGGPYSMYGWSFFLEFQILAGRGLHVVYTNLLGSAGYGRAFMRALVGRWGFDDYMDLMRVADALAGVPFVDPQRIALTGGSYGGYLTNFAIGHTRRFKCAISVRGVSNLVSLFGTSDTGTDLLNEFEAQAPWESIDRWWRVSPLAHVGSVRTPLLLLHGEEDHRCPVSQAEEMFTALRLLGRDVELVRFAGESHGMSRSGRPHARIEQLRRIAGWLDAKL
jgi:dipeptidyl aminopeptidase/acylaminoacyl peptidase